MTINWYRPSQCVLLLVTISSILVFLGCLACGFLLHFAPEEPSEEVNGGIYVSIPTIALLGAAVLTALALALGCCGACRDSKMALVICAVLSLVVAGILVGSMASVFTFTMNGTIKDKLHGIMLEDLKDYSEKNITSHYNIFNKIQENYNCCGVGNYSDWIDYNTTWKRERNDSAAIAPSSCCTKNKIDCNRSTEHLRSKGCLDVVFGRLKLVVYSVFGCSIVLALLLIFSAMFACYGAMLIHRYQSYDIL